MIYERSARRLRDRACQIFLAFVCFFFFFLSASSVVVLITVLKVHSVEVSRLLNIQSAQIVLTIRAPDRYEQKKTPAI